MPSRKLKILFVTSEVVPFVKTGGLADVSAALPQKLQELGHQVRIVVPKYGAIDERKYKIHEVVRLKDLTTNIGESSVTYSIRSSFLLGKRTRVQIYFLDNFEYFASRHSLYNDPITSEEYSDNFERFLLFTKSVFDLIEKLGWYPDIIHCNDWQGGLIPVFMKFKYAEKENFKSIKVLFTIHSLNFQGEYSRDLFSLLEMPESLNTESGIIHNNKINMIKAGVLYSDLINTVSETYSKEICKGDELSSEIKKTLCLRENEIFGIINGIDTTIWNPEKDKIIAKKYSSISLEGKIENKIALLEKFALDFNEKIPVIGMISRLYESKGFDLIQESFHEIMKMDLQLVLLGSGDKKYHYFFEDMLMEYRDKFSCYLGFDDQLAHLIEAGSDMFLMPSKIEPCGLNQMYSLIYGTVPIVRKTGGLADTVTDYESDNLKGNGFLFEEYSSKEMINAIARAMKIFPNSKEWTRIIKNGMKSDFNWLNSAKKYLELYKKVLS